jgi:hypothetical protein
MSANVNNLFGVACKTCRRRGKKCDRNLPTCKSCSKRGVQCEGYAYRWINPTTPRISAGRLQMPRTTIHAEPGSDSAPRRASTSGSDSTCGPSQLSSRQGNLPNTKPSVVKAPGANSLNLGLETRRQTVLRQPIQSQSILKIARPAPDGLAGLLRYCTILSGRGHAMQLC